MLGYLFALYNVGPHDVTLERQVRHAAFAIRLVGEIETRRPHLLNGEFDLLSRRGALLFRFCRSRLFRGRSDACRDSLLFRCGRLLLFV